MGAPVRSVDDADVDGGVAVTGDPVQLGLSRVGAGDDLHEEDLTAAYELGKNL